MATRICHRNSVKVSASGKVLIVGGYAILENPNPGLVLASTARFHTTVSLASGRDANVQNDELQIKVHSPQYLQHLDYRCSINKEDRVTVRSADSNSQNSYVEQTIGHALTAVRCVYGVEKGLDRVLKTSHDEPVTEFSRLGSILRSHFEASHAVENVTVGGEPLSNLVVEAKQDVVQILLCGILLKLTPSQLTRLLGVSSATAKLVAKIKTGTIQDTSDELAAFLQLGEVVLLKSSIEFLTMFCERNNMHIGVLLQADNDFYSQSSRLLKEGLPLNSNSLKNLEPFLPCIGEDGKVGSVSKTGLGSSAAMFTSLTASLLSIFGVVSLGGKESNDMELVHRVAQIAHGVAQGKIGSGFDVCAAVHGNIRYVRYSPSVIKPVMDLPKSDSFPPTDVMRECQENASRVWDHSVTPFVLPRGFHLICGDICGGSETPSMSRKIIAWKTAEGEQGEENRKKWTKLIAANKGVEKSIATLVKLEEDPKYDSTLEVYGKAPPAAAAGLTGAQVSGDVVLSLNAIRTAFVEVRKLLKDIGNEAGVPVEPDCQTKLCDATASLPGVVASGVPGAGGYDAIFALYVGGNETREQIESFWEKRPNNEVCPLLLSEIAASDSSSKGLSVTEAYQKLFAEESEPATKRVCSEA